jgi:hypothetical protein
MLHFKAANGCFFLDFLNISLYNNSMTYTIEDALETLAGTATRTVNVRLDNSDKLLVKSLSRQVKSGVALTDRQLELSITKIIKYKTGLIQNNVDVDHLVLARPLRMPIREIDRTQSIKIDNCPITNIPALAVKFVFSKKISQIWKDLTLVLTGVNHTADGVNYVSLNEMNLKKVVDELAPMDFIVDHAVMEIYEKIQEISKNPVIFAPYIDTENDHVVLRNVSNHLKVFIDKKFPQVGDDNFLAYLDTLKKCGIFQKNPEILKKIEITQSSDLTKKVILENETRVRFDPAVHDLENLVRVINDLNQWPLVVILEENSAFSQVLRIHTVLGKFISDNEMTVFFRLDNHNKDHASLSQFVKDHQLNNYIDSNIKAVVITKNKIPKPLLKADWHPETALVLTSNDFGKTAAYLNDFSSVYYYNNSIMYKNSKTKGAKQIAEL